MVLALVERKDGNDRCRQKAMQGRENVLDSIPNVMNVYSMEKFPSPCSSVVSVMLLLLHHHPNCSRLVRCSFLSFFDPSSSKFACLHNDPNFLQLLLPSGLISSKSFVPWALYFVSLISLGHLHRLVWKSGCKRIAEKKNPTKPNRSEADSELKVRENWKWAENLSISKGICWNAYTIIPNIWLRISTTM